MTDVSTPLDPITGLPPAAAPPTPAVPPVTATTAPAPTPAPPAEVTPPVTATPAPAEPSTDIAALLAEIQAMRAELKAAAPKAPAVEVPANPPSPVNLYSKGQIVRYAWDDPYDGPSERFGLVVDTLPDEGSGAQSRLVWFTVGQSGPIGDHTLTAV